MQVGNGNVLMETEYLNTRFSLCLLCFVRDTACSYKKYNNYIKFICIDKGWQLCEYIVKTVLLSFKLLKYIMHVLLIINNTLAKTDLVFLLK